MRTRHVLVVEVEVVAVAVVVVVELNTPQKALNEKVCFLQTVGLRC